MPVPPPNESLRNALARVLGDHGHRAERFLVSAAKQLNGNVEDPLLAHHGAYALREAMMAIINSGGTRPRGMTDAADEVVRRYEALGSDAARLADSIRKLKHTLEGPGPNVQRLERSISQLAGLPPTRANADLIARFIDALDAANRWTHAPEPPPVTEVEELYSETMAVLHGLFGPMSDRLIAMDDLVRHPAPGPEQVTQLKQHLGDERHLIYLFERAEGPGWFRALSEDSLLMPPRDRPWTAGPYVLRVAQSHRDDVRTWLRSRPVRELNARQAAELLRVARTAGGDVGAIGRDLARNHFGDSTVRMQADALVRELTPAQRDTPEVRTLIQGLLGATLVGRRGGLDAYMAAEQLNFALEACRGPNAGAWLRMLAHRTRDVAEGDDPLRMRFLLPVSELTVAGARRPLDLAAAALRRAATSAADAGVDLKTRVESITIVPEPLASRLLAQQFLEGLPGTFQPARAFIDDQIADNEWPSPEELALTRRLIADAADSDGLAREFADRLGSPPDEAALDALEGADTVPGDLVRAHRWLVAIPVDVAPEWHSADDRLPLVPASLDGVMIRASPARFVGPETPITVETLSALTPLEAAKRVADWRPSPEASFFGPSAEGLAGTLRQTIDARRDEWMSGDPLELASALREPLYITAFVQALSEHVSAAGEDAAAQLVALVELVRSAPWPAADLGADPLGPQNAWRRASDAAVQLLGRLAERDALNDETTGRVWRQIADAFEHRGDANPHVDDLTNDPLGQAINRPSMRALEVAFTVGGRSVPPDNRLLDLLDRALVLEGADGLHARAIIAARLHWLRQAAPDWFVHRANQILGPSAPNALGPATMDLYLEWAQPDRDIAVDHRNAIVEALSRDRHEDAVGHLLLGVVYALPGYEPDAIADVLVAAGEREVSEAGHWMGWALAEADPEPDAGPLLALWRDLLQRELSPPSYAGFGWTAINKHIPDGEWLELIEATLAVTSGSIHEPDRVAQRAARHTSDPRAARIITGLLSGRPTAWDLQAIGAAGLEVLAMSTGEVAHELRERLLERGFHEALDFA